MHTKTATAVELVVRGLIRSAGGVQALLKDVPAPVKVARVAKELVSLVTVVRSSQSQRWCS